MNYHLYLVAEMQLPVVVNGRRTLSLLQQLENNAFRALSCIFALDQLKPHRDSTSAYARGNIRGAM